MAKNLVPMVFCELFQWLGTGGALLFVGLLVYMHLAAALAIPSRV